MTNDVDKDISKQITRNSFFQQYHENGRIIKDFYIQDGMTSGSKRIFADDGELIMEDVFLNNKKIARIIGSVVIMMR